MFYKSSTEGKATRRPGKILYIYIYIYIYKASRQKHIMNEQYITDQNVLFELLLKHRK
jgi:hypothetical protein